MTAAALTDIRQDYSVLARYLEKWREKPFRLKQVQRHIEHRGARSFSEMSDLPASLRERLADTFRIGTLSVSRRVTAADGTEKYRFRCDDGAATEAVFLPNPRWNSVCVSCQIGCGLGCRFCATASLGFVRQLTAWEIVEQLLLIRQDHEFNHAVFMGMGEPLLNEEAVIAAVDMIHQHSRLGFSKRNITVSTAGVADRMVPFAKRLPVGLAVSLNTPFPEERQQLMPLTGRWPLTDVYEAIREIYRVRRERVTLEYVMLSQTNVSIEHADALRRLLEREPVKLNLIRFNDYPGTPYRPAAAAEEKIFMSRLVTNRNQTAIHLRRRRGENIDAACGQLCLRD